MPDDRNRSEFRRMLWISALLHGGVLSLVLAAPAPSAIAPPTAIIVDLVAAPPSAPRSAPAPPPAPAVKPPPPAPKKVLPEKPRGAKPKPTPKKRREVVLKPKPRVEKSLEDLLAEMRDDAGEVAPEPLVEAAVAPDAPAAAVRISPEEAAWRKKLKRHVKRYWIVPPGFRSQRLQTHVVVRLDTSGRLLESPTVIRESGNPWFDDGVVRGIKKASPLPPPPEPGEWPIVFAPEDSY